MTNVKTAIPLAIHMPTIQQQVSYYIQLTKPRILTMILLTVVMAMVATGNSVGLMTVLHACLGTALVAAAPVC